MSNTDLSRRKAFLIETEALARRRADENVVVLETGGVAEGPVFRSGIHEYVSQGHIPGALFADLVFQFADTDSPWQGQLPTSAQFARAVSYFGIRPETEVVVYDRGISSWAARLLWVFREHGYRNVRVLDGGLQKWIAEGRPVDSALPVPAVYPRAEVIVNKPAGFFVGTTEVQQATADDTVVVCALPPVIFDGSAPTNALLRRAGHIPGSSNLFAALLIDGETGGFVSDERIAELMSGAGLTSGAPLLLYCGTGVLSTLLATGLAILGVDDVHVYDGSLEEWTANESLPIEA